MNDIRTKKLSILLTAIMCMLIFFSGPLKVNAKQNDIAGATGFTYSVNFPDNQIEKDAGYYHLKVKPGDKQVVSIVVSNPGKQKITLDISLNGAKTNQNGVIEYGDSEIKGDPSLKYDFKDIVKGPEKIELAPGETKNLDLTIQVPEIGYEGVIAGGVQLMREGQDEQAKANEGSKIVNQYAYVVGILLQESDQTLTPELQFNKIEAKQSNYRNAIFVNFSNIIATYVNNMTVEVQVMKKGNDAVLYERKQTEMRMAPNSFISFPVSMNGEKMVAGEYNTKILVTSGDKKWTWDESFSITNEEANKYNERDVGLIQEKSLDWKLILSLAAAFLVSVIVLFLIIRFVRNNKNKKNALTKKKLKTRKKKDSLKTIDKKKKSNN